MDELKDMIALLTWKQADFDFTFEASLQGDNERVYGGEANTAVSFLIGQIR